MTLCSNSVTRDPDQHSYHCVGKQPDTTRTYPTLPLKLDPKFIVPPPALFGDHNTREQLHSWAKQKISKPYKITPVQKKETAPPLKTIENNFFIRNSCWTRQTYFPSTVAAPPIFTVITDPSSFICQKIHLNLTDTQKTPHDTLSSTTHTRDSSTYVHYKFNLNFG